MIILRTGLVCLLLAGLAISQTSSAPVLTPRPKNGVQDLPLLNDSSSSVPPDAAVITVNGVCDKPAGNSADSADCKTIVTRAQFEKLVNAVQPNMPKAQLKRVASAYAQFLILASKGHELGLDKGPEFEEQMYLVRLQFLARVAQDRLQKDAGQISDAEIESYYREHSGDFKTISYDKIYVPKQKQAEAGKSVMPNDPDAQKKREAGEAAMKEEAEKVRARAAAGEDFVKLQQEAYDFAGLTLKSTPANTHVEKVRKTALPQTDASIFELKKGDVSQVLTDPAAFMIYKVDDFQDQQLADVKEEVSRALQGQKLKTFGETMQKSINENTTYDDAYFAVPSPPSLRNPGGAPTTPAGTQSPPAPGKK